MTGSVFKKGSKMEKFIENEIEILEGYNFSYFCGKYMPDKYYKWAFILLSLLVVSMFPGLRKDAFKSPFFYILVVILMYLLFLLLKDAVLRPILKNKIKMMKIKEHLFIEEDEILKKRDLGEFFCKRKHELLVQYKKGEIDLEVLKKLYLKKGSEIG